MLRLTPLIRTIGAIGLAVIGVVAIAQSLPARPGGPDNAPAAAEVTDTPAGTPMSLASEQPTPTVSAEPQFTASPSATIDGPSASSTAAVGEALARSDTFWNRWVGPPIPEFFMGFDAESLADATRLADLVIRGRVTGLYVGEHWRVHPGEDPIPLAYISVQIDEILKGEPVSRSAGFVEVQIGTAPEDLEQIRATIPAHGNLWFLMYGPKWNARTLEPQRSSEMAPFEYFALNPYQGVFRDIDGEVRVMQAGAMAADMGDEHFPLPLDGTSFEDVVGQVRELTQSEVDARPAVP